MRVLVAAATVGAFALSVGVQLEAPPQREAVAVTGARRALVVYHPSRDAGFSDALSLAIAEGLAEGGLAVERATATATLPDSVGDVALLAVVTNTYWWAPDRPTSRWLARARLAGVPTVAIVGGAGSTGRAERLLAGQLRAAGAAVRAVVPLWILRPNDETRPDADNRAVAASRARALGVEHARRVLRGD